MEFPWLWAIQSNWELEDRVQIMRLPRELLSAPRLGDMEWWMKVDSDNGVTIAEEIIPVTFCGNEILANAVMMTFIGQRPLDPYAIITHLVAKPHSYQGSGIHDETRVVVFKPPKGLDMHKLIVGRCA